MAHEWLAYEENYGDRFYLRSKRDFVRKVEEILISNRMEDVCNYSNGVMSMLKND
jgi:hypothetical protein